MFKRCRTVVFFALILLTALGIGVPETKTFAGARPNIVFILADDLDFAATEPYWREIMPFSYSLRAQGINLLNSFSAVICCEARAGILTGMQAHNNGVYTNAGAYGGYKAFRNPLNRNGTPLKDSTGNLIDNENRTFAKYLQSAGYRTSLIGKYMNDFKVDESGKLPLLPKGWDDVHVFVTEAAYAGYHYSTLDWTKGDASPVKTEYGLRDADYSTDVVSNRAVAFLNKTAKSHPGVPFLMYVAPTAPHLPLGPAPRHRKTAQKWKGTFPLYRPNFYSDGATVEDKPLWLRATWNMRNSRNSKDLTQFDWEHRLGSLYALDDLVRSVFNALKANNQLDNTLIVFASDNGYNLGAHGLNHKMAPYEESLRVPAFAWGGTQLGLKSGVSEQRTTLHYDYAPTFLELAGVTSPTPLDGLSLLPLLKKGPAPTKWRSDFFEEYLSDGPMTGIVTELPPAVGRVVGVLAGPTMFLDIPTHRMVRGTLSVLDAGVKKQKTYSYIQWYADHNFKPIQEDELYDLDQDPYQLDNLQFYNRSGCEKLSRVLASRLSSLMGCKGKACSDPLTMETIDVSYCRK